MTTDQFDKDRRSFLGKMILLVMASGAGLFVSPRKSAAMAAQPVVQGMHRVEGEVRINNATVKNGALVGPDDVITTGAKSHAVFVVGNNAFLLRDNSRLELSSKSDKSAGPKGTAEIRTLRMAAGKLLSVFGLGAKTFITSTAVCGVRGTGMYVEAEADRTYVCTCYGEVELGASASLDARETVKATHHNARYINGRGAKQLIEKAGMLNHTDEELIMLESLVNRRPPFVQTLPGGGYRDPYQ